MGRTSRRPPVFEPDHVVVDSPELAAELDAILARFGVEAVIRAVRAMVEQGETSSSFHGAHGGTAGES
jgi:hypothetical protein